MLLQYVRDSHNHKVGVVVAIDRNLVGWSKCCKKDKFDKKRGIEIAIGRAMIGSHTHVPHSVGRVITRMIDRSQHYYKEGQSREN